MGTTFLKFLELVEYLWFKTSILLNIFLFKALLNELCMLKFIRTALKKSIL